MVSRAPAKSKAKAVCAGQPQHSKLQRIKNLKDGSRVQVCQACGKVLAVLARAQ